MSALPPKAEIDGRQSDVRFGPICDIGLAYATTLLGGPEASVIEATAPAFQAG